MALTSLI
jgi:hypothetical protein